MRARAYQDYTVVFSVVQNDALTAGLVPGDFVARVFAPDGAASTALAVAETSAAEGTYAFTVPAAFLDEDGTYVATVVVSAVPAQVQTHFIEARDPNIGVKVSVTWVAASNQIVVNAWLEDERGQPVLDVEDCSVELFTAAGVSMDDPEVVAAPLANGVFHVVLTAPALGVGEHAAFAETSITLVGGPTYTAVTGLTFSRTS